MILTIESSLWSLQPSLNALLQNICCHMKNGGIPIQSLEHILCSTFLSSSAACSSLRTFGASMPFSYTPNALHKPVLKGIL